MRCSQLTAEQPLLIIQTTYTVKEMFTASPKSGTKASIRPGGILIGTTTTTEKTLPSTYDKVTGLFFTTAGTKASCNMFHPASL